MAAGRKGGLLPDLPDGWFEAVRQAARENVGAT